MAQPEVISGLPSVEPVQRVYGQPNQPEEVQAPVTPLEGDTLPTCPLSGEPCMMESCAWFNDYSGYCWVPEGMLQLKLLARDRRYFR